MRECVEEIGVLPRRCPTNICRLLLLGMPSGASVFVCVGEREIENQRNKERERQGNRERWQESERVCVCVQTKLMCCSANICRLRGGVVTTHTMLHLYGSFSAKEPYN